MLAESGGWGVKWCVPGARRWVVPRSMIRITMKAALLLLIGHWLAATALHAALPVEMTFTGVKAEHTWTFKELNGEVPKDWTGYEFLVLEFKASSSQRFDLGLETS